MTRNTSEAIVSALSSYLLLVGLVEDIGETALAAVLAVVVAGHENTSTALFGGALATDAGDLAVVIDLVELQDSKLVLKRISQN